MGHPQLLASECRQSKWATEPKPLQRSARKHLEGIVVGVGGQSEGCHNTPSSHCKTENAPRRLCASRALIVTVVLLPGTSRGQQPPPHAPRILGRTCLPPPGFEGRGGGGTNGASFPVSHESDRGRLSDPPPHVPVTDQLLHHRLVPVLAHGRPGDGG